MLTFKPCSALGGVLLPSLLFKLGLGMAEAMTSLAHAVPDVHSVGAGLGVEVLGFFPALGFILGLNSSPSSPRWRFLFIRCCLGEA